MRLSESAASSSATVDAISSLAASSTVNTIYKINPSSSAIVATLTISSNQSVVDLATCNYANSLRGKADVRGRAATTDQFTLTNTGGGISVGNTATTTGTATGVQTAVAGANLVVGGAIYTVTQSAAGTTNLADYSVTWKCVNNTTATNVASGTGNTASFTYPTATTSDGSDVVCTFLDAVNPAAVADSRTTPINTTLTVPAGSGLLANDLGASITVSSNTAPSHGVVTVNANGSYAYVPTTDFTGIDTFDYTITDVNGATASATATINVTPTAADDTATIGANTPVSVSQTTLIANDHGTSLTVVSVTPTTAHGTAVRNSDGSVTYTPNSNYSGPDNLVYTVQDASGQTTTATVNISVTPTAGPANPTTTTGTPVTVDAAHGLLSGATGTSLTATLLSPPTHGTVVVNPDGSYTYTPNPGYTGVDSFTFTVTDASNQTTSGTATVTVEPPASAQNDRFTGKPGQPATVDVLGNDSPVGGSTFDLNTLSLIDPTTRKPIQQVTVPREGTWTIIGNKLKFTPLADFTGTATIRYQITDTSGATVSASASIVYPAAAVLGFTGTDAAKISGLVGGGSLLLLLGLLLLVARARRNRRELGNETATATD